MLRFSHTILVVLSGMLWLVGGCILLPKGINLLLSTLQPGMAVKGMPLLATLAPLCGDVQQALTVVVAASLLLGYVKGRFVFRKSVSRVVGRITSLPNPATIFSMYSPGYCLLLGSMVMISVVIKMAHLSPDIHGAVDLAIGSALINGAVLFFRDAAKGVGQNKLKR